MDIDVTLHHRGRIFENVFLTAACKSPYKCRCRELYSYRMQSHPNNSTNEKIISCIFLFVRKIGPLAIRAVISRGMALSVAAD
jgi:hypothetical protein